MNATTVTLTENYQYYRRTGCVPYYAELVRWGHAREQEENYIMQGGFTKELAHEFVTWAKSDFAKQKYGKLKLAKRWVSAPGETLLDALTEQGLTVHDFAKVANIPYELAVSIVNGIAPITPEIARKLTKAIGASEEFWLERERQYRA